MSDFFSFLAKCPFLLTTSAQSLDVVADPASPLSDPSQTTVDPLSGGVYLRYGLGVGFFMYRA